jgi:hypothetical protein
MSAADPAPSKEEEMKKPKLRRPSAGVVLGTLALVVAIAGNTDAFSATKTTRIVVRKGQIAKGAVTASTISPGAVHPKALAKGAVTAAALKPGAVEPRALASDAVGSVALAPGSVYGGALGAMTVHSAQITDADSIAHNGEWTASSTAVAVCGQGERLASGGIVFTNPGDAQVGIIQSAPSLSASGEGWVGRVTTDSGGSSAAEVQALCLK